MKRQTLKTPIVISGIFLVTLLAVLATLFYQLAEPDVSRLQKHTGAAPVQLVPPLVQLVSPVQVVPPLAGHWLRTATDPVPASPQIKTAQLSRKNRPHNRPQDYGSTAYMPADRRPERYMNRTTDNINVMYVWTDGPQLKVISVTTFNKKTRQTAIMVIPLHTRTGRGDNTVADLYRTEGRPGVRKFLEQQLEISIPNFVRVNQEALRKLSDLIGPFDINGETVTMANAFEQTAAGARADDREIVKAVGSRVLTPATLLKVPRLLWIFNHDIKTNFSTEEMIEMFHLSRRLDLGEMRKITLPGTEYAGADRPYLFVFNETWKNIIYDVTQ